MARNNHMEIKPKIETIARIKVVGVGGSGHNAIHRMITAGLTGVGVIAVNSDAQSLHHSKADRKVQIGKQTTRGLGAGMNAETGRQAAEENKAEILEAIKGADMVFVPCGLGGGTGSGAGPVVAGLAEEEGILTVAVVTKPFAFEGAKRREIAEKALEEFKESVDTIIVIPNDRILQIIDKKTSPLLEVSIDGAKGVLFNVTGGKDLGMYEVDEAAKIITRSVDSDAKIIFGAVVDDSMSDEVRITVIATGFEEGARKKPTPKSSIPSSLSFREPEDLAEKAREPIFASKALDDAAEEEESELEIPAFIRKKMK